MRQVDNSTFNNSWYHPGKKWKIFLWYFVNILFFQNKLNPFSKVKIFFLRLFGAKIGQNVLIKPGVNIKYPWFLKIGNYSWIGENVWIDNLCEVTIEDNVCISQGAMLLTGNHDYKKVSFNLILGKIHLETGVWIGAKSIVAPGVTCKSHSVLCVNSVATRDLESYTIFQGNPAIKVKERIFY